MSFARIFSGFTRRTLSQRSHSPGIWHATDYCTSNGKQQYSSLPFEQIVPFKLGPPTDATVPAGQCVLGTAWAPSPLLSRINISEDTVVLTFGLGDDNSALDLSTCACLVASGPENDIGQRVARAYTPVSTNAMLGQFELLVKVYEEGVISQHLNSLSVGDTVDFKHVPQNVKIQHPFGAKHIGMIAGGTGLTPMIQALHAILGNQDDTTTATLVWSNKRERDISVPALNEWAEQHPDRFTMVHTLTREPEDTSWGGRRGRINRAFIEETMPSPSDDCKIFVCGTPTLYDSMESILKEMNYDDSQIVII